MLSRKRERIYCATIKDFIYLKVDTAGRKYWLLRFGEAGKEHQISLGVYPDVSLNEARKKRDDLHAARGKLMSARPDKKNFQETACE
ncbi:MAG: DUF4102 domain-containing protein [Synergistaceae bacterium]|nr:DUF4102 domain-containing protein [Synergistaceae bacterium]